MSFQDELRKSLEPKGDEAAKAAMQEAYRAAEYNYNSLKRLILQKARCDEVEHGKISGIFKMEANGNMRDYVPYDDPFEFKGEHNVSTGGFLGGKDIHRISVTVQNMARLDAAWEKMRAMAEADGIQLGEPFLYGTIYDDDTKRLKKELRFERRAGKLSGELRFTRAHGLHPRKWGESGSISIAVEYECRV